MKYEPLIKPVFFIGMPRSGTTILYEAFSRHERLGWLSNYSALHPSIPSLNLARRILDNEYIKLFGKKEQHGKVHLANKVLPKPSEAYKFWENNTSVQFSRDYLLDVKASVAERDALRLELQKILKWQGKSRFSAKLTGPSRITYLNSVFNDAIYLHVIRDGRAVVNSLLKVGFWSTGGGLDRPWWENGLPQPYFEVWKESKFNPAVLAAVQWRAVIELARQEAEKLDDKQYYEVRYEEFIENPHTTLVNMFEMSSLNDSTRAHDYIDNHETLKNMNYRYKIDMRSDDIRELTHVMQPLLSELDYI